MLAIFASDMTLRETGHANAKAILLPDELDELVREFEAARRGLEVAATGRIAAQREDIFHAESADLAQQVANLFARGINTRQVRDGGQAVLLLDPIHDHQGLVV